LIQGGKRVAPFRDLVTINGARHDWRTVARLGAGAIAIYGRRFLRNKITTSKIPTVAAIKAPVRISSREKPT
jgi:hypothetical protein